MTPTPDAITMIAMAIPMCALYFGAIGIGALRARKRARGEE
jgi:sec-independent protein translocase protein TatC